MSDEGVVDVCAYCRKIEEHLTRTNGGHLVKVVGPAFEIVRQWSSEGIPLNIVFRAIEEKVERHTRGNARYPLRIEHCDADVRRVYETWRRAIGVAPVSKAPPAEAGTESPRRQPSLTKHLDRVIERLSGTLGRLDLPDEFRDRVTELIGEVSALRDRAKATRGPDRLAIARALPELDRALLSAARAAAGAEILAQLADAGALELASYRSRLAAEPWQRAIDATVDRSLRARYGLPIVVIDDAS